MAASSARLRAALGEREELVAHVEERHARDPAAQLELERPPVELERRLEVADLERDVVDPDQPRARHRWILTGPPGYRTHRLAGIAAGSDDGEEVRMAEGATRPGDDLEQIGRSGTYKTLEEEEEEEEEEAASPIAERSLRAPAPDTRAPARPARARRDARDPVDLEPNQHRLAAILGLVVVWWVTEAIPIPITGLIGVMLCAVLEAAPAPEGDDSSDRRGLVLCRRRRHGEQAGGDRDRRHDRRASPAHLRIQPSDRAESSPPTRSTTLTPSCAPVSPCCSSAAA